MIRPNTITNVISDLIEIITEGINLSEHPRYTTINRIVNTLERDSKDYAKQSLIAIDLRDYAKKCKNKPTEHRLRGMQDILNVGNQEIGFVTVDSSPIIEEPVVEETTLQTPYQPQQLKEEDGVLWERDENGKITQYRFSLPATKNKRALIGVITREEMEYICEKYSVYGDNLQQRQVVRGLRGLTPTEFRRVLTAFGITKASSVWAPHQIEELGEQELLDTWTRCKENRMIVRSEAEELNIVKKLLDKTQRENIELKKNQFTINLPEKINSVKLTDFEVSGQDLILHISDMHIGAKVNSGSLYQENYLYGVDEAKKRLDGIIERVYKLGYFDHIIINLLGDNVDCCGIDGKTARLDHHMPTNLDCKEQAQAYMHLMLEFISSLIENQLCSKINVYSVPCGNHGGNFEYACNMALINAIKAYFPDVETKLFDTFFGAYEFNNHKFIICHGKDEAFMKKGLPLNLDATTHTRLQEWLDDNKIYNDNIHFIKGDLHSESINSCRRFTYRNVLSLFGASDYSNYNFSRNSYGVSYEMFIGDQLIRGTFENI